MYSSTKFWKNRKYLFINMDLADILVLLLKIVTQITFSPWNFNYKIELRRIWKGFNFVIQNQYSITLSTHNPNNGTYSTMTADVLIITFINYLQLLEVAKISCFWASKEIFINFFSEFVINKIFKVNKNIKKILEKSFIMQEVLCITSGRVHYTTFRALEYERNTS